MNRQADQLSKQGEVEQGFVPYEERVSRALTSEDLFERINQSNPVVRMQAFAELLQNGDESPSSCNRGVQEVPEGYRFSELRMLAFSWAQSILPPPWLGRVNSVTNQRGGSGAVMDSWSRSDPSATWAKENFEGEDNPYFIGIVSGMSETDMAGATELMTSMPMVGLEAGPSFFGGSWTEGRRRHELG